jgi:transposase
MGERMKAIEKSDFNTIDDAWEAHKARNNIAHQGGGFALNQREARRIISLYERVFREFQLI